VNLVRERNIWAKSEKKKSAALSPAKGVRTVQEKGQNPGGKTADEDNEGRPQSNAFCAGGKASAGKTEKKKKSGKRGLFAKGDFVPQEEPWLIWYKGRGGHGISHGKVVGGGSGLSLGTSDIKECLLGGGGGSRARSPNLSGGESWWIFLRKIRSRLNPTEWEKRSPLEKRERSLQGGGRKKRNTLSEKKQTDDREGKKKAAMKEKERGREKHALRKKTTTTFMKGGGEACLPWRVERETQPVRWDQRGGVEIEDSEGKERPSIPGQDPRLERGRCFHRMRVNARRTTRRGKPRSERKREKNQGSLLLGGEFSLGKKKKYTEGSDGIVRGRPHLSQSPKNHKEEKPVRKKKKKKMDTPRKGTPFTWNEEQARGGGRILCGGPAKRNFLWRSKKRDRHLFRRLRVERKTKKAIFFCENHVWGEGHYFSKRLLEDTSSEKSLRQKKKHLDKGGRKRGHPGFKFATRSWTQDARGNGKLERGRVVTEKASKKELDHTARKGNSFHEKKPFEKF